MLPMSGSGTKRTRKSRRSMPAFGEIADIKVEGSTSAIDPKRTWNTRRLVRNLASLLISCEAGNEPCRLKSEGMLRRTFNVKTLSERQPVVSGLQQGRKGLNICAAPGVAQTWRLDSGE